MPAILAFDTSTGPVSVALRKGGKILSYQEEAASAVQSARLVPMIEKALKDGNLAYKDLFAVACTIGPGSFTGIRVGLATARGICLAAPNLKGLGYTTLEVLAYGAHQPGMAVLALLNAGKGEVYYQGFDALGSPLYMPKLGTLEAAAGSMPSSFITAGNVTVSGVTAAPMAFPRADTLANLAAVQHETAAALQPFYIRPPDATPLKPKQTVL